MSTSVDQNSSVRTSVENTGRTSAFVDLLLARNTLLAVYVVAAVLATAFKLGLRGLEADGLRHAPLQNVAIFRNAFFHLIHGQDLYTQYPSEQWDFYKYSPTFALLMGPIAVLPYGLGSVVWNLLNAVVLFGGVWSVPVESNRRKAYVLWFVLLSLLVDIQNAQSNALVAGLMVATWSAQERGKSLASSFYLTLSVFTKLFGGLAILPCLLYPRRRGTLIGYAAMWGSLMAVAPLTVVSPRQLQFLYRSWYSRLQVDGANHLGLSMMGVLKIWFHLSVPSSYVVFFGALVLVSVLAVRFDAHEDFRFRLLALSSVLLWVIVFNHMAESPTMIIGVTGIAIWYYFQQPTLENRILVVLAFLLVCVSPTDAVPQALRRRLMSGYLEAAGCILIWIKVQYDLFRFHRPLREAPKLPQPVR